MRYYLRLPHRDTWHYNLLCQHYKRLIDDGTVVIVRSEERPSTGELCNECQAKTRKEKQS